MKFNNINVQLVGSNIKIGSNVKIGDNTTIYDNVIIEDNTIICNDCIIGEPTNDYYKDENYLNKETRIGKNSLIRSHNIIYSGSEFGEGFSTGHRVTIRENSSFGINCSVGTLSDIQGYVTFGDYCRLHSNVHIGQKSKLGNYIFVYPYVVFTNDPTPPSEICVGPTVGNFSIVATASVVLPGIVIGENCLIAANSVVGKNVEDFSVVGGSPAKLLCDIRTIKSREKDGPHYPWMYNFERTMPWKDIGFEKWKELNLSN
jgi:acetyltransferase-like isoleucine patch superfamily enzyme